MAFRSVTLTLVSPLVSPGRGEQSGRDGPPAVQEGGVAPRHHALAADGVGHRSDHAEHQRRGDGPLHRRHAPQPVPPQRGPVGHLQVRGHSRARQDARVRGPYHPDAKNVLNRQTKNGNIHELTKYICWCRCDAGLLVISVQDMVEFDKVA